MVHIYYNGILFSRDKEGNPAICNNMDTPWRHYAKWVKSDKEGLMHVTYMWNLKKSNL